MDSAPLFYLECCTLGQYKNFGSRSVPHRDLRTVCRGSQDFFRPRIPKTLMSRMIANGMLIDFVVICRKSSYGLGITYEYSSTTLSMPSLASE